MSEEINVVEVEKKVINKFDSITNLKLYYYFQIDFYGD